MKTLEKLVNYKILLFITLIIPCFTLMPKNKIENIYLFKIKT